MPPKLGAPLVRALQLLAGDTHPLSMTSRFPKGDFPFHTDTAHWTTPCRYLILYSHLVQAPSVRHTMLLDMQKIDKSDVRLLARGVWRVATHPQFVTSAASNRQGGNAFRWDEGIMEPVTSAAKSAHQIIPSWVASATDVVRVSWDAPKVLIVDNWRLLHTRDSVPQCSDGARVLHRMESLWSKAVLYIDRGQQEDRGSELFLFWHSLSFEFLLRSSVAYVSPALLAERSNWRNALYSVQGTLVPGHKAISNTTKEALEICKYLIKDIDKGVLDFCDILIHKRNEELHTGASAFAGLEMPLEEWLVKFYRACNYMVKFQQRTLVDLLGDGEGEYAGELLVAYDKMVLKEVLDRISAHRKAFASLPQKEIEKRTTAAVLQHIQLRVRNHHQVTCPACGQPALISGGSFASREPKLDWDSIVEKQEAIARRLECYHCLLRLSGLDELLAANVQTTYTRTITHDPAAYFDLDVRSDEDEDYQEYDNE